VPLRVRLERFSRPTCSMCITAALSRGVTPLEATVGVSEPSW